LTRSLSHILSYLTHILVITRLGNQPRSLKYFCGLSFDPYLSCPEFYHCFVPLKMAEAPRENPDLTRALQAVAQNLLSPAFQDGETSAQPR